MVHSLPRWLVSPSGQPEYHPSVAPCPTALPTMAQQALLQPNNLLLLMLVVKVLWVVAITTGFHHQWILLGAEAWSPPTVVVAPQRRRRRQQQHRFGHPSQSLSTSSPSPLPEWRVHNPTWQQWTKIRRRREHISSSLYGSTFNTPSDDWKDPSSSTSRRHDDNNNKRTPADFPPLMLYNSKSRTKEVFRPLLLLAADDNDDDADDDEQQRHHFVSMYTCGPTVYDFAHVGNFRAFLTYDLIKRVLKYLGYSVKHICNLTDIDDKIIQRATDQNIPYGEIFSHRLTKKYERYFLEDLRALNVVMADHYPRATEHIEEMMEMILELESNDLAYETEDGSWYFSTADKEGYGEQLVQLNRDDMEMTEKLGESEMKRNPQDFALWKAFKPGVDREDASWESERFQKGRPGWHLECSAMARKYLGDTIDIHGGGVDLKFPHHENEIAQSEGATGKCFCNCWLHNGFVNINDEKMSKSLGNFLTLRTACPTSQDVRAYRYLVMSSQYSKPLSFTPQAMDAAKNALKRIDKVMQQIEKYVVGADATNTTSTSSHLADTVVPKALSTTTSTSSHLADTVVPKALSNFEAALLDDLSMPRASASLFSLIKAAEKELKRVGVQSEHDDNVSTSDVQVDVVGLTSIAAALRQMDDIFGIFYEVPLTAEQQQQMEDENGDNEDDDDDDDATVPNEVMELVVQRSVAKEAQDWELADSLRSRISELGFAIKDVKGGTPVVTKVES